MAKENENVKSGSEKVQADVRMVYIQKPAGDTSKAKVVGLNGVMYTVPYNKQVEVPAAVAEIIERSLEMERREEEEKERLLKEYRA